MYTEDYVMLATSTVSIENTDEQSLDDIWHEVISGTKQLYSLWLVFKGKIYKNNCPLISILLWVNVWLTLFYAQKYR